ncbi:hypothetical protein ACFQZC_29215 [Streptacidiphilus monticola]
MADLVSDELEEEAAAYPRPPRPKLRLSRRGSPSSSPSARRCSAPSSGWCGSPPSSTSGPPRSAAPRC